MDHEILELKGSFQTQILSTKPIDYITGDWSPENSSDMFLVIEQLVVMLDQKLGFLAILFNMMLPFKF